MQSRTITSGVLLRHALIFVVQLYWMLMTSFKPASKVITRPPTWSFTPTVDNYVYAFEKANFAVFIRNTVVVASLSTLLVITFGSLAAYSFARYNTGDGHVMFFILTTRMMPAIAALMPFFL